MLTDVQIRKAKAADKPYKLTDGGGLHIYVSPAGGKLWRLRYEFDGREKLLSLGPYPSVGLAEARDAAASAKRFLREGRDPAVEKRLRRLQVATGRSSTFEAIAREWHELNKGHWVEQHAFDVLHSLERDVFPDLGSVPIKDITAANVIAVLRQIEDRPAVETARRIRQRMSAVFVYAIASGRAENDPAAAVQKAMKPLKKGRQPAVTDLEQARTILRRADETPASPVTKLALRLLALTALRPGTLIAAPWVEFEGLDPQAPIWIVPAERMKLRLQYKDDQNRDHLVPLSTQALDVLRALRVLTGRTPYLFPNQRHAHRPASENAIGYLLNRAGYHHRHVPHGWRATFSTVMNERYKHDRHIIDLMLAHVPKNAVEGAYNRAEHLDRRIELAQAWADLLMIKQMPVKDLLNLRRSPKPGRETAAVI
ncbi:tyrosine-type recombinase/integrase [Bradyrhizobium sp. SZCCHNR1020]|uniref:tyrosine-type recombinase/integrase n=1 Tax=Bradyrhizobium sp. SZCCHNR1020 TaxID=3057343 RepID=UPI002915F890|nr:integrase arm-type DNA-binding domain-containing protein [Bradyrhizobium sp. SZCCHNR1020]